LGSFSRSFLTTEGKSYFFKESIERLIAWAKECLGHGVPIQLTGISMFMIIIVIIIKPGNLKKILVNDWLFVCIFK